ncbi:MAG: bifunctional demethylmenaquinone methyltransferase/2-methoxy-6-polyprenyl-1,4-benzoquinol methylase UbiE [Muribaculaceae bacterium]|nr:bifunctional demethylmenaquinone methyltransferase/2-methoxy-6-polyprenyl-1,4-benzoquinol methylase UbiE [Muribaculaceae bacterium]
MQVEEIKPYSSEGDKAKQVEQMFDSIAPAYDFMNRAMTLGIDRWWRRVAVKMVKRTAPRRILDVATGTGDFAIDLYRKIQPEKVVGIDLSQGMLDVARQKIERLKLQDVISVQQGDCLALPFQDGEFDAVTVAFGVRNFEHLLQGYKQMSRVLRPGGMLCVIELSTPRNRVVRWFYDIYTLHIIPWIGALKSHDRSAYRYLPKSIAAVPQGDDMLAIMREAGFADCQVKRLTFGTCSIYTGLNETR